MEVPILDDMIAKGLVRRVDIAFKDLDCLKCFSQRLQNEINFNRSKITNNTTNISNYLGDLDEINDRLDELTDTINNITNDPLEVMNVQELYANGINGGSVTDNADTIRDLNTVITNTIDGASLSGNTVILPAGTYDIYGSSTVLSVAVHRVRLDVSNGTNILGISTSSPLSTVRGRLVLTDTASITMIEHVTTGGSGESLGSPVGDGFNEVYADLFIVKIA